MSISSTQRARLGLFMTIGMILIIIFISIPLWFKIAEKTKIYYAYFKGESVSGLSEGAEVKYHGVLIGKVANIKYEKDDLTKVKVTFRIKDEFPVKKDMYCKTWLTGITGMLFIEILGGSNEAENLEPESIIPSKTSLMTTITGKTEVIINKVELLLNHLNMLTNPDSLASIKNILYNVEGITLDAHNFVEELSPNIVEITKSTKRTLEKVEVITGNVQSITEKFDREVDMAQLVRIMNQIDSTAKSMKNLTENLDMTIQQSREDITVSMENLRETLENANELSRILVENPSLILKGDPQKERRLK
jgi:phospholipid/cholesterol/gamma-HCH transport system substrate-binding protein